VASASTSWDRGGGARSGRAYPSFFCVQATLFSIHGQIASDCLFEASGRGAFGYDVSRRAKSACCWAAHLARRSARRTAGQSVAFVLQGSPTLGESQGVGALHAAGLDGQQARAQLALDDDALREPRPDDGPASSADGPVARQRAVLTFGVGAAGVEVGDFGASQVRALRAGTKGRHLVVHGLYGQSGHIAHGATLERQQA
jgi:hypothetical protein